ncbi:hypothetical protein H072_6580 [Dactylellina haptotyla CBS 200.50]|uniref:CRIB domain-containing protein n=1 Tax=Dactylellina haptotyla (strain CBS 200.50) TaxID=1284197 RepID=S8AEP6_DACHA|nr:hypothetical protein H072_6580 [Dactylellina haptotyla CBS 200.50]
MLTKIKEAGRQVARSNSVSNESGPEQNTHSLHTTDKRRYTAAFTDITKNFRLPTVLPDINMDRRPPLRKRGSSLFNKMTSQETYDSLVPRSTSSSRMSERTITDNRDSHFSSLSTRIKAHRMRKNSQLSLSLGPLEEHEIRQPNQARAPPQLLRTHSVPDLLSRSQALSPESRKFCNGKPISNPFNFRHLSHMETQQTVQMEDTPEDILPLQWNVIVRESKAPKTPIVPLTPLAPRSARHMQSLSGSLRTIGLPLQSPSAESVYSPVDSIAELSMRSKSAESLNNSFPSHLAPPPRSSSRTAFTGSLALRDDDIPLLESEGRDSIILLKDEMTTFSRAVNAIIEEEPSLLDQEVEDDVLGAFPSPPSTSTPMFSSVSASQPNIAINNQLLPPLSPLRPSSSSSGTLGFGNAPDINNSTDKLSNKRSSKRISKRMSRRISILGEAQAEIQSWEADIDWTYDNNDLDEWVDDLEGIEEEEESDCISGSKSAPVSASPSTVNLTCLDLPTSKRHSDDGKPLAGAEDTTSVRTPEIGVADGGFGIFDNAGRQYNAFGHQRQLSKTRNGISQRTLSTCASLPNLKAGRKHYRNSSLRGFSNLDNGIVTLDEIDELHYPSFQKTHSAPREVAIPPARYSGRSRAASNATCTTLVSDIEGYPSDLSEMASTPSHSSHNSAEGPYFLTHNQDGLFMDTKGQLSPSHSVQILNDEAQFNFF